MRNLATNVELADGIRSILAAIGPQEDPTDDRIAEQLERFADAIDPPRSAK